MNRYLIAIVAPLGLAAVAFWLATMTDNSSVTKRETDATGQEVYTDNFFRKSPNDNREYHSFRLNNGMRVLLISDPDSKKSAASLDLDRGSGNNPRDYLGIAHYLEHMLFLGTEKYPEADGFQEFIGEHGGNYNAYTSHKNTNYFFDVRNDHFSEALDRFADFFIAPTFNLEFAERERNVVDSEFHTGLNEDGWRYYAVFQELLNPKHPMSLFTVGTKETLKGDASELISQLRKFYDSNYRSRLMKLVLYSNRDINELKQLASKYFEPINAKQPESAEVEEPIILAESLPALAQFKPIKEVYYLDYYFPIPSQIDNYAGKPAAFISHLLNSKNQGGLEDILKKRGWSNGVHANLDISLPEQGVFNIHISLTAEGNKYIKEITSLVFATLEEVKQISEEEWRYDEVAKIKRNRFKFSQQGEPLWYVRSLSRQMQVVPPERWLSNSLWDEYNPVKIKEVLEALVPRNMLMVWVSPAAKTSATEKYYKVPYDRQKLSEQELQEYLQSSAKVTVFPPPNPFISEELKVAQGKEELPMRLRNLDINAWHKFNQSYNIPKVTVHLSINSELHDYSAKSMVYNNLMTDLIANKLNTELYQGGLGGYYHHIRTSHYGFYITISGYNDKIELWVDKTLDVLREASFAEEDFSRIYDNHQRSLRNQEKNRPTNVLWDIFGEYMFDYKWPRKELQKELDGATLAALEEWTRKSLAKTNIMAFVYGNIKRQKAHKIVNKLKVWNLNPLNDMVKENLFAKIHGKGPLIVERANKQGDSAAMLYYQAANNDYTSRVKTSLLTQILHPQFFLKLRTEQEVGYIVHASYRRIHDLPGISFTAQSNHLHSDDILDLTQRFIDYSNEFLSSLSEDEFANYKEGLLNLLRKPPQNYSEELDLYRTQIAHGFYNFDDREKAINALEKLTRQDIITYASELLQEKNSIAFATNDRIKRGKANTRGRVLTSPQEFQKLITEL